MDRAGAAQDPDRGDRRRRRRARARPPPGRGHYGRKKSLDIILVERNRTHIWKPLLHEVAAGSLDANLDEVGYRSHCHRWGYRFFYAHLPEGIDRDAREVVIAPLFDDDGSELIARHRIRYDYLVIAVGSVTNDFGIPGVAQNCMMLDDRDGADRFRNRLLNHCLRVSRAMTARGDADEHVQASPSSAGAPPGSNSRPNCTTPLRR